MKHTITSIVLAIIYTLIFGLTKTEAYPVIIEIEAVVDYVEDDDNYLEGQIDVGDIITGYYTYEPTTEDSIPLDPIVGHYNHDTPPAGVYLTVGGFEFQTDPCNVDFLVGVGNNGGASLQDGYWIYSYNNLPLSNGTLVDSIVWQLDDPSGAALSSDALPATAPILGDWPSDLLRIYGDKACYIVNAHVTSAVPEPTSIFLIGLGALMFRRKEDRV